MAPLRALFFTTKLGGGGAEKHALRIVNALDRARVQPAIAVCRRGGAYEPLLRADVPLHHASFPVTRSSLGLLALAVPKLRRTVRELAPDVVVAVMDPPALVAIAAVAGLSPRPRVVACVQIPPSIEYGRTLVGRALILPGIRRLYPRADRIVALSRGVAGDAALGAVRDRIEVIHNACVDDLSQGGAVAGDPGRPVVVAAGRLTWQKAFPELVDAFALLRARVDAELWILGEGPDRAAIEERVRRQGLGDAVQLLGFKDDPLPYLRRASVLALSSRYEGFGNVIVEALACGTPVVATDCPHGPAEILAGEQGGVLVPVDDARAMADALARALGDPALRARLAAAGRARALAFTSSAIAGQYATELERVCGVGLKSDRRA